MANRRLALSFTFLLVVAICAALLFAIPVLTPGQGDGRSPNLEEVDGGRDYYARFSNPLPARSDYFPIAGFLRPAFDARRFASYADFGMNVFLGVENPELTNEAMIRRAGMQTFVQSDERRRFNDIGSENVGHFIGDEVDMCCGPPDFAGGNGYQMLADTLAGLPQDGKARFANYGKGVMFWESDHDAQRFVNEFQDIVSNDIYWFTDPNERNRPGYRVAASYGTTVDRMRHLDSLDGRRKPIWNVVELGWPFTESAAAGGRRILPAELRAAVWHSIIAGARGIVYFDHNFGPGTPGSTIRGEGYQDTRAVAISVNRQIKRLASVLNAPTLTSGWTANSSIRAMVKWQGGHFYVFAGSRNNVSSTGRVSIPCVGDAKAVRLGEAGRVPISGGSFTDSFADGNAIHIYRIDGGSTCGLPPPPSGSPPSGSPPSGSPPPNGFTFGKLKRNLRKGTAKLTVRVSGPGALRLKKTSRVRGVSKRAAEVGSVRLRIRPRGEARRRLKRVGERKRTSKAEVTAKVRYRPTGGEPSKKSKRLTLKRRHGRR